MTVHLNLEVGSITTGLWCETCLLPSRYEAELYALGDNGVVHVGKINRCYDGDHA